MLYILKPKSQIEEVDTARGFVVRAKSNHEARTLASQQHGDEGADFWLNTETSTCTVLKQNGDSGVIIRSFFNG